MFARRLSTYRLLAIAVRATIIASTSATHSVASQQPARNVQFGMASQAGISAGALGAKAHSGAPSSSLFAEGFLPPFQPSARLEISYEGAGRLPDEGARELHPSEAKHAPTVVLRGVEADAHYTLIMFDPDAPSPDQPSMRSWLHWLVTNVPGDRLDQVSVRERRDRPPSDRHGC
jgi:hypothetical protein